MDKEFIFRIIFYGMIISFLTLTIGGLYTVSKDRTDFCIKEGFKAYVQVEDGTRMINVCVKIEDGYRVEKKFTTCGKEFCFIRDTLVEVDE